MRRGHSSPSYRCLIRDSFSFFTRDEEGRVIYLDTAIGDKRTRLFNVYVRAENKRLNDFFPAPHWASAILCYVVKTSVAFCSAPTLSKIVRPEARQSHVLSRLCGAAAL